jgi:signal transduction histidine kinase/molybdopterin biosynthesis enzyme MoaB
MRAGLATAIVLGLLAAGDSPSTTRLPRADPQKHVLVLQEFRRDTPLAAVMEDVYRRMLGEALGTNLDYYSEFLDTARLDEADYRKSLLNYLEMRYSHVGLDVVIATTTATLNLIRSSDGAMFDGMAVVFHGGTGLSGDDHTTGVVSHVDFRRMLEGAIRLQPQRRRIAIVSGAAPFDRGYARLARQQLINLGPGITLTWLTELPIATVEQRILALPDDAMVFCLSFTEDSTGQRFVTNDIVERLASDARVPFFGVHEVQVGHGIVGGRVFSSGIVAARTAELALRVLNGEVPGRIRPIEIDPYVTRYDWRELRRWNIAEASLPAGADIVFREPGFWETYRPYVIGTLSVIVLQTALIAGLLAQRASRRRAQGVLRASEAALRASNDRARTLAGRLIVAQEAERTRLARDLHDDACQQIAGLSVELSRLKHDRAAADRELQTALVRLQQRSAALAENLRLMSHQLHPSVLQQVGLVAALESHRLETSRLHSVTMELDIAGEVEPLDQASRLAVFRIAQEAVRNAVVHGRASRVAMSLERTNSHLALSIRDDGTGFDVEAARRGGGLGLVSIEERARLIKGSLSVVSQPGSGTVIDVIVPAPAAASTLHRSPRPVADARPGG